MEIVSHVQAATTVEFFSQTRDMVALVLWIAALSLLVTAFIEALRASAPAFTSAGKLTKNIWLVILGIGAAAIFAFGVLNIFGIAGVIAAAVFMIDVRPAVRSGGGGRRGRSNEGPYGPW